MNDSPKPVYRSTNTDVAKETGLNNDAVAKILKISSFNETNGLADIFKMLILHPKFEYFLFLISFVPSDMNINHIYNNNIISASEEAIINVELINTVHDIADDIRRFYKEHPCEVHPYE